MLGYKFEYGGKVLCTAYDHEMFRNVFDVKPDDPGYDAAAVKEGEIAAREENEKVQQFFKDADILVHDTQYTHKEYLAGKIGWGHSSFEWAINSAHKAGVKHLVLFHHEPLRNDQELEGLYKAYMTLDPRQDTHEGQPRPGRARRSRCRPRSRPRAVPRAFARGPYRASAREGTRSHASAGIQCASLPSHFTLHPMGLVSDIRIGRPATASSSAMLQVVHRHLRASPSGCPHRARCRASVRSLSKTKKCGVRSAPYARAVAWLSSRRYTQGNLCSLHPLHHVREVVVRVGLLAVGVDADEGDPSGRELLHGLPWSPRPTRARTGSGCR